MNLKFWTSPYEKLYQDARHDLEHEKRVSAELGRWNEKAAARLDAVKAIDKIIERVRTSALPEPQVAAALNLASDDNPLWSAIQTLLLRERDLETQHALQPGLSDEDAHYYRGRAAGLLEFQAGLLAKRQKCQEK